MPLPDICMTPSNVFLYRAFHDSAERPQCLSRYLLIGQTEFLLITSVKP